MINNVNPLSNITIYITTWDRERSGQGGKSYRITDSDGRVTAWTTILNRLERDGFDLYTETPNLYTEFEEYHGDDQFEGFESVHPEFLLDILKDIYLLAEPEIFFAVSAVHGLEQALADLKAEDFSQYAIIIDKESHVQEQFGNLLLNTLDEKQISVLAPYLDIEQYRKELNQKYEDTTFGWLISY